MEEDYRSRHKWWFEQYDADLMDYYLETFPELKGKLSKFCVGIFQWNLRGEINVRNPDDICRVRMILKVLYSSPAFDFFDQSFNEYSPEVVCEILGMSPKLLKNEPKIKFDYNVTLIKTFEEANEYSDEVSLVNGNIRMGQQGSSSAKMTPPGSFTSHTINIPSACGAHLEGNPVWSLLVQCPWSPG